MVANQTNPVEDLRREIESAKSKMTDLVTKSGLSGAKDSFNTLDTQIANLPLRIKKVRERKYAFNKIFDEQAVELQKQWGAKKIGVQSQINTEANNLRMNLRPLEARVSVLQVGNCSLATVKSLKNDLENYESRISSASSTISSLFDDIQTEVGKITRRLDQIDFTLENAESASFGFLPTESVVMAVKAVWTKDRKEEKDDPDGILYLTDQRLIFEQKEQIATKKVLFITTEREKVQKLQFEVPVVSIESVKASKQGMFKNEDWLELVLAAGSFDRSTNLHLNGQDCNEWQKIINLVKTGEISADRALAIDQAAVDKVKTAPTKCPNCGGAITKPVLRGQETLTCEFCGNVIRL